MDYWADWDERLHLARGVVFDLPTETGCIQLDQQARWTDPWGHVVLQAGTQVRYVETGYDAMRLDQAIHKMKVVSGPQAGSWVGLLDVVGPGPLRWER